MKELRRDSVRSSSKGLRDEGVKGLWKKERISGMLTLLCSVSVNLAELRRVLEMKYFQFMDKIVTDGVGHLEG